MATEEHRGTPAEGGLMDRLVDGIWEESTRLESVLVVHAYSSLRQALARTLQHYGYRTFEASSREQALRLVREERPDVILLDRALGENEGIALAVELARRTEMGRIPMLAITSDRVPEEALRAHGFREALVIPVEQRDLLAAVDRALEPARRAVGGLHLEAADEQCRLPLEDGLRAEHLSLFFHFSTISRVELRAGSEVKIRTLSARLASLGIQPEIEMQKGELWLRYEVTIAEALSLCSADATDELVRSLCDAYPELTSRLDALRRRVAELEAEYRRLQRIAS